jgi:CRP-like cAMP-binding protein
MPSQEGRPALSVRTLLESTGTPFETVRYDPRAVLFFQGDTSEDVMHIEEGRVRLAVAAASGKEVICGLLEAGAFLGEEVLGGHAVRPHTAIAMTAGRA